MYTSALLVSALAGSAFALHPVHELMRRQTLTPDIIPSQCQDTCSGALPIYNACLGGDQATCLSVCEQDNFDAFVGCFNCIIQAVPGASSGDFQSAQEAIGDIEAACQQVGSSISGSGLETGAASSTSGGAGASFTSASSAITVGGSGTLATPSFTGPQSAGEGPSLTSSANGGGGSASMTSSPASSASGAGAASSSAPNAGTMNAPQGLAALILGAIGAIAL